MKAGGQALLRGANTADPRNAQVQGYGHGVSGGLGGLAAECGSA